MTPTESANGTPELGAVTEDIAIWLEGPLVVTSRSRRERAPSDLAQKSTLVGLYFNRINLGGVEGQVYGRCENQE